MNEHDAEPINPPKSELCTSSCGLNYWAVRYKYLVAELISIPVVLPLESGEFCAGLVSYDKWTQHLRAKVGYAWDGASGPAVDTESFMRASLFHDILYQMIREGILPKNFRGEADSLMRDVAIEDGMWRIRAMWSYGGVRLFGGGASRG